VISNLLLNTILLNKVYAELNYYRSELDITEDGYIRFGDSEHPQDSYNSISFDIDETSISSHWVNILFYVDEPGLIEDRDVDKFLILGNGKIIEEVYLQYEKKEDGTSGPTYEYLVKPSSTEFIGSQVDFQIVAVDVEEVMGKTYQYAVAWSEISNVYQFDPLPVRDSEAIEVLYSILSKLQELWNKLKNIEGLLSKISDQIETLLTPSEEAMQRFENAQNQLWEKMPNKQVSDKANEITNMFDETKSMLDEPESQLQFGEKRDWFGIGVDVYLFDLTGFEQQVRMFRHLLSAVIWIEFLFFLLFYLAPKFDI
jgi:hypothetical protein